MIDFGLARSISSSYLAKTDSGTKEYQGLEYDDLDGILTGCKGEIWSLGWVLFIFALVDMLLQVKMKKQSKKWYYLVSKEKY